MPKPSEQSPAADIRWSFWLKVVLILVVGTAAPIFAMQQVAAQDVDGLQKIRSMPGASDPRVGVEELQQLRVAALQHEKGDFDASLGTYRGVYGQLKAKLQQEDHPLLLEILLMVTDVFLDMGQFQQAEGPLVKQLDLRELKLARQAGTEAEVAVERARIAASRVKHGLILSRIGRPENALEPLENGATSLAKLLGEGHRLVLESRLLAARIIWSLGQFQEAVKRMETLVAGLVTAEGLDAALLEQAREDLGTMYLETGRMTKAIGLWDRELADLEGRLRPDDPKLLVAYRRLGEAYAVSGDYEGAEQYWRKGLKVSRAAFGDGSGEVAADLVAVGVAMELLDKRVGAINSFDGAATAFEAAGKARAVSGNQTRFVRRAVESLFTEGLYERAARLLEMAMLADQSRTDASEVDVAEDRVGIARCLIAIGDMESADVFLRQALSTVQRELGNRHIRTLEVVGLLAKSAAKRGDHELGSSLVDVVCKATPARQTVAKENDLVETVALIGLLLDRNELSNRADDLRGRWLAMRESQYGTEAIELTESLVAFADAFQVGGMSPRAIPLYERAIAIREKAFRPDHPAVAAVLLPLARAFRVERQEEKAAEAARQALTIWDRSVGPEHEVANETVKLLAASLYTQGRLADAAPLYERMLGTFEKKYGPQAPQVATLLGRVAEVTVAAGDAAAAERYLNRAIEIGARTATGSSTAMVANLAQLAKIERTLGKGDGSKYLERARELAAQTKDAEEQRDILQSIASASGNLTSTSPAPGMAAVDQKMMQGQLRQDPVENLLAIAEKLERSGNRTGAQATLEQARTDVRRRLGDSSPIEARLLVALGDLMLRAGEYSAAFVEYQRAVALLVTVVGEEDPQTVAAAMRLAAPMQIFGDLLDARSMLSLTVGRLKNIPAASRELVVMALRMAADYAVAVGDQTTAAMVLEKLASLEGTDGQPTAKTYEDLADVYLRTNAAERAVPLREKLLSSTKAAESQSGKPTFRLARRYFDLATTLLAAGQLQAAETQIREAVRIDELVGGKDHPAVARDVLVLAAVLQRLRRSQDAATAVSVARAIVQKAIAAARIEDTTVLREVATACVSLDDLQAAGRILETVLAADIRSRGRGHLETAADHFELATVRRLEGDFDRSAKNYERVVSIYGQAEGPGSPRAVAAATLLADMQTNGNKNFGEGHLLPIEKRSVQKIQEVVSGGQSAYGDLLNKYADSKISTEVPERGGTGVRGTQQSTADRAERAKRMLGAVTGLFGGGSGDQGGLNNIINYSMMVEGMAQGGEAGIAAFDAGRRQLELGADASLPAADEPSETTGIDRQFVMLPAMGSAPGTSVPIGGDRFPAAPSGLSDTAGRSPIEQLSIEDLVREAWRRHLATDTAGSAAVLERAVELAEQTEGHTAAVTLDVLAQAATILLEAGRLTDAQVRLEELLSRRLEASAGRNDPVTLGTKMSLADLQLRVGDWAGAWPLAAEFLSLTEPLADTVSFERAEALLRVATIEEALGRTTAAWPKVDRARQILGSLFAARYGRAADTEAGRELAKTLADKEERFFVAVIRLCRLHAACGDVGRASAILSRLLETPAAVDAVRSLTLEQALLAVVDLAEDRGNVQAARSAAIRVAAIRQEAFGPLDPRTTVMEARLRGLERRVGTNPPEGPDFELLSASLERLRLGQVSVGRNESCVWLFPVLARLIEQADGPLGDSTAELVEAGQQLLKLSADEPGGLPIAAGTARLLACLAAIAEPALGQEFGKQAASLRRQLFPVALETAVSQEAFSRLEQAAALHGWGRSEQAGQLVEAAAAAASPATSGDKLAVLKAFDGLIERRLGEQAEPLLRNIRTSRRLVAEYDEAETEREPVREQTAVVTRPKSAAKASPFRAINGPDAAKRPKSAASVRAGNANE